MSETKDSINGAASAVCDALRYFGDVSYAVLPHDVAHSLGDLKKSLLACARTVIEKEIEWVDERVAGGDKLREQWRETYCRNRTEATGDTLN